MLRPRHFVFLAVASIIENYSVDIHRPIYSTVITRVISSLKSHFTEQLVPWPLRRIRASAMSVVE